MRNHMSRLSILLGVLVFLAPGLLHAQANGEITGSVIDQSGGVIPNVRVTATNIATGGSQSTVTSSAGTYTIPLLLVGTYSVKAESNGFKTAVAEGITLDVSQQRQVNFTLVLPGVQSTVEITAAPPLLTTTNGSLAGLVTGTQVQNLPLNGRAINNLVMIQPGMTQDTGTSGFIMTSTEWISNGNRGETLVGTLDGADVSDPEFGSIEFDNFNLDAIAEFKVQQNNYSAEYGQGAGTITQIVSKSGTNQFHGSAFDYVRNSAFDARNFFASSVPPFKRNEFGATFGGPIKKDKTFFFGEYAGLRQRLGEPNLAIVPTQDERNGIVTVGGDELQVPLVPAAQTALNKYPLPNQPNGPFGANTYNAMFSQPTNDDGFSVRVDQHVSNKDSLFARASYMEHKLEDEDPWAAELGGPGWSYVFEGNARNYAIGETHLFSPTLLNEFNFSINRGLQGVPEVPGEYTTTSSDFLDGTLQFWGPDTANTWYTVTVFHYKDDVVWTKGRHSLRMGGEFQRLWDNGSGIAAGGESGTYYFNAGTPLTTTIPSINGGAPLLAGSSSPSGMISMMEGDDAYYGRSTTVPGYGPTGGGNCWYGLRRSSLAAYLQDDFKVTHKLTLNLGLRYEYTSVPTEVDNRFAVPEDHGPLIYNFVANPRPLWPPDYLNFAPRVGFAANLGKKTVVRGGFAIFTNQIPTVYPDQALTDFPLATFSTVSNAPYFLVPQPVSLPALMSTSGQPVIPNGNTKKIAPNTPINIAPFAAIVGVISGYYPASSMRNGYTISGNITFEHEFAGDIAVQASYVANNGVKLYYEGYPNAYTGAEPQYTPYSNVTPGLGELAMSYNGAYSKYNGLQVQARKISTAHGLQFQASYTYSNDLTDADSVWTSGWVNGGTDQNNPQCLKCNYSRASYSVRQRFVANFEYNLPFGRWQALSRLPGRLTQGWQMLGIFNAQSGFPFSAASSYGTLPYGFDTLSGYGSRPFNLMTATRNSVRGTQFFSDAVLGSTDGIGTGYFGLPTVTSPVTGNAVLPSPGNLARNTFTGPGWQNFDCSVIKDIKLTESKSLQFRAEFFNVLNQTTFATPGSILGSGSFGIISSTATAERQIQFGLKFIF